MIHCTNEPNVSIPQLANLLIERSQNASWVVVFKSLITVHHLMCYGNEVRKLKYFEIVYYDGVQAQVEQVNFVHFWIITFSQRKYVLHVPKKLFMIYYLKLNSRN